jgi:hypothetical protein
MHALEDLAAEHIIVCPNVQVVVKRGLSCPACTEISSSQMSTKNPTFSMIEKAYSCSLSQNNSRCGRYISKDYYLLVAAIRKILFRCSKPSISVNNCNPKYQEGSHLELPKTAEKLMSIKTMEDVEQICLYLVDNSFSCTIAITATSRGHCIHLNKNVTQSTTLRSDM